MRKHPTDLKVLKLIYKTYYQTFVDKANGKRSGTPWNYVTLDIEALAQKLKVHPDLLFGRLYYYMDEKYRYEQPDGTKVYFIKKVKEDDTEAINFPLLEGVLANLKQNNLKYWIPIFISSLAMGISIIGLKY